MVMAKWGSPLGAGWQAAGAQWPGIPLSNPLPFQAGRKGRRILRQDRPRHGPCCDSQCAPRLLHLTPLIPRRNLLGKAA